MGLEVAADSILMRTTPRYNMADMSGRVPLVVIPIAFAAGLVYGANPSTAAAPATSDHSTVGPTSDQATGMILAEGAAGLAVATGLSGAFAVGGAILGKFGPKSQKLYRAVKRAELEDIQANGCFKNPPGIENKYFSSTPEGAASFAKKAQKAFGDGPYTIVETSIPQSAIKSSSRATVDQGIDAITVADDGLGPSFSP